MVLSESASYDDAVSKYAWMKYTGSRGKEVSQRTHKRMIREGDTFGILPLRNGGRYTLIFPDMPHVDFPLDKATGLFLIERSSKLRKVPDVVNRDKRTKVAGAQTLQRQLARTQFDAARFSPKSVKSEAVYGVNFDNYQWRMVADVQYPVKTTKGITKLYKNDMIGVRYLRQGKGGIIVNTEGMYLKVDDAQFDLIVHDTNILPFNDWPKGELDVDTVKAYRRLVRRARRRSQEEQEEAARLAQNARVLEQKQQRKELQKQARKTQAERAAEMRDLRNKVKSGEIEAPQAEVRTVYADMPERAKRVRIIEHEDLDDAIEEDLDLNFDEQKMEEVLTRSPFAGDVVNIEDTIGSLFGGDDSSDADVDPELDLSDIDEPEDDEEQTPPPPKVRKKAEKAAKPEAEDDSSEDDADADAEDDSEEDTSEDEDTGEEEDAEDADSEEEEDTSDDEDADAEEEDDADVEEDADDSDSDESDESDEGDDSDAESVDDAEDDDGTDDSEAEDEDADADTSDAVDETEADEDGDSDVAVAEREAAKTAKKIAAANESTPGKRADEAEEGDVLLFKADAKLRRDWLVLKVSTHTASDNIVIYTLYDITNSPDEVRQVRVNRARKQNLFDYAEHVKDMAPKLFNRVYDMAEDFPVNKDPIAS